MLSFAGALSAPGYSPVLSGFGMFLATLGVGQTLLGPQSDGDQKSESSATASKAPIPGDLFSINDLPRRKWMPRRRRGKTLSKFTILRWCLHGRGGIRLRSVMVGGLRCTTDRWAQEFFQRLADPEASAEKKPDPKDHERAVAELTAAGI
jgi:hypothetical protein